MEITHKYDDIINMPHHVSESRAHMPMLDRTAQFSPFDALTGYDAAVVETARLTDQKLELDETQKEHISEHLQVLSFTDGTEISFDSIYLIQSEVLRMMENE